MFNGPSPQAQIPQRTIEAVKNWVEISKERLAGNYTTLTNAVRGGARHACKWEKNASWTIPETQRMVVYGDFNDTSAGPILPGLSTSNVQVVSNGPSVNNIDSVTVKITGYNYVPLFDIGKLTGVTSLSLAIPMNASATMHQLYNGPTAGS